MKQGRHLVIGGALLALVAGGAFAGEVGQGQVARPAQLPQANQTPPPRANQTPPPRVVRTQPSPAVRTQSPLPNTQALFDSYVATGKMPGIVGAFGVGDRPTIFVSAGRIADGPSAPAAGPDSLWRVYSMTKPVTAMAAMILIEEGRLKLDQPVADLIPAFRRMTVQVSPDSLQSRPATRPITIRNLLTHTAGLGYNIVTKGPLLKEYERLGLLPAALNDQFEQRVRNLRPKSLEEFADRVASLPLIADPGTKWSYSMGLDVLGRVIEVASGMRFDAFVQQRIFDPLRMTSSYWTVPGSQAGRLATNYAIVGDTRTPLDTGIASVWLKPPSFPYGGAGLVMSARDYDRFLHMLQDGGALEGARILRPETVALAMSNLLPPGVIYQGVAASTGGTSGGPEMGFGAGGSVYLRDKPGGAGRGTYSWGGAAGTIFWVDPLRRARGTVMVNYFPGEKWPIRQQVPVALLADYARYR